MDHSVFQRTGKIIENLRKVLECKLCKALNDGNSLVFYKLCEHFFCDDCVPEKLPCPICNKSEDCAVKLSDDENMSELCNSVLNFKLPDKDQILKSLMFKTPEVTRKTPEGRVKKSTDANEKSTSKTDSSKMVYQRQSRSTKGKKSAEDPFETPAKNKSADRSKGLSSEKKINVSKKNHKGETPLHLACKKSDFTAMKNLINLGADVNAQDNADWTPLHDAIYEKKLDVAKFLLENGGNVNTFGSENMTPLHIAVDIGNIEAAELLVQYGADINATDINGKTPLGIVKESNNVKFMDILLHTRVKEKSSLKRETVNKVNFHDSWVIMKWNLDAHKGNSVTKFALTFKVKGAPSNVKSNVTHIVVENKTQIALDWSLISLIDSGSYIVDFQWIADSLKDNVLKTPDEYIITSDQFSGFEKSRLNKLNQLPGLFSGCHFFFGGLFDTYIIGNKIKIPKNDLKTFIEKNGGKVLKRAPDPESPNLEYTIPYHADPNSTILKTCYYIIYQSDKWDPKPKYNMAHVKTLPIEWLIASIFKFHLLNPENKDMYLKALNL